MKKKRYFCDFWFSIFGPEAKKSAMLFLIGIVAIIAFLSVIIIHHALSSKFNSYSPATYERLNQIADDVIMKGVGIDIDAIPNDVESYNITYGKKTITFQYCLKYDEELLYELSKEMVIELSKDYEIISKASPYDSENRYTQALKFHAWLDSCFLGIVHILILFILFLVCGGFTARISQRRKNLS